MRGTHIASRASVCGHHRACPTPVLVRVSTVGRLEKAKPAGASTCGLDEVGTAVACIMGTARRAGAGAVEGIEHPLTFFAPSPAVLAALCVAGVDLVVGPGRLVAAAASRAASRASALAKVQTMAATAARPAGLHAPAGMGMEKPVLSAAAVLVRANDHRRNASRPTLRAHRADAARVAGQVQALALHAPAPPLLDIAGHDEIWPGDGDATVRICRYCGYRTHS